MKRTSVIMLSTFLLAACNGDEQEHDVQQTQHATPAPMPAAAPADTVGAAATDSAAHTTTH